MAILNNSMPQQPQQQQTPPPTLTTELSQMTDLTHSATNLPTLPSNNNNVVDESAVNAEVLTMHASSLSVTLINDLNGRNVPVAELRLSSMNVDLRGWSTSVCFNCYYL